MRETLSTDIIHATIEPGIDANTGIMDVTNIGYIFYG